MGMYLVRQIGTVTATSCRTSWCFWTGRHCPGTGPSATVIATLLLIVCWCLVLPCVRLSPFSSSGCYYSIITQAMTFAAMLLFFRNETGFGGNNGFTDFKLFEHPVRS
jgi:urea transport system permease protein